jgi:hypothetical protein
MPSAAPVPDEVDLNHFAPPESSETPKSTKLASSRLPDSASEDAKGVGVDSVPPTVVVPPTESTLMKSAKSRKRMWLALKVLAVVVVLLGVTAGAVAAVGFYTYGVVKDIQNQSLEAVTEARGVYDQFKGQNLPAVEAGLKGLEPRLNNIENTYRKLKFFNTIPVARTYYKDGEHMLNATRAGLSAGQKTIASVAPYADVLGFTGEGTFTGGTAEDRLKLILQTLQKVTPALDEIKKDLDVVNAELAYVDPNRYPESVQGRPIRQYIQQAKDVGTTADSALTDYRPVLEQIPAMAGGDGSRKKYLILFENNGELRPTGGFLTGYATIFVENGKVAPEKSDDIYELDKKFRKQLPIPEKLGKYLTTESRWNLRDMNTNPDFRLSMDQFLENYKTVPSEPKDIDGIIAVDTHVLVEVLKILGPVEVPGYGTFSAENDKRCDCPNIIYEMSNIITRPTPFIRENRKGILGPMMRAILDKTYAAPRQEWPKLFEQGLKLMAGRHIQVYVFDEKSQAAIEKINAAGALVRKNPEADFLAVINANLGGAKSNFFITNELEKTVGVPTNGRVASKVVITYTNSRPGDNCNLEAGLLCLNARNRDWTRIYVPKGAELTKSAGFREGTVTTYDEGEFTVFDGEFFLDPKSTAKLELEYTVPYANDKEYTLELWKQAGISPVPITLDVNGNTVTTEVDGVEQLPIMDKDLTLTSPF